MPVIRTYIKDSKIESTDLFLGSDSINAFRTVNFTAELIRDYIRDNLDSFAFYYIYDGMGGLPDNSGYFQSNNSDPLLVTSFTLNKINASGSDLTNYINSIASEIGTNSKLFFRSLQDPNSYYRYDINTFSLVGDDLTIGVQSDGFSGTSSFVDGDSYLFIIEFNKYGTYTYTQSVPSATWNVSHNLGRYPSVTVVDSANSEVVGDINYTDNNNLTITFSGAFSGKAFLN